MCDVYGWLAAAKYQATLEKSEVCVMGESCRRRCSGGCCFVVVVCRWAGDLLLLFELSLGLN